MKEAVVLVEWINLALRIGWKFWSLLMAFCRREISGALETRRARTPMPVPPGTARHQLYSVPPTHRPLGSTLEGLGRLWLWLDML